MRADGCFLRKECMSARLWLCSVSMVHICSCRVSSLSYCHSFCTVRGVQSCPRSLINNEWYCSVHLSPVRTSLRYLGKIVQDRRRKKQRSYVGSWSPSARHMDASAGFNSSQIVRRKGKST